MLISTVTGLFSRFEGMLETRSPGFDGAKIELTVDADSVYTNESYRDNHIKSADFLNTDRYPAIRFSSTTFTKLTEEQFLLIGQLTIKEVTREVELAVSHGGIIIRDGITRAGFHVTGSLNRKAFGLTYSPLMEAGGMIVSEEIDIIANVELIKQ